MLSFWERLGNQLTGWRFYRQPPAERVACWQDRRVVSSSIPADWPELTAGLSTQPGDPSRVGADGVGSGTPMQNGTARTRRVTWGWPDYGEWFLDDIPTPARGEYLLTGHPTPAFDKRCIVAAGDDVFEMIQFRPDAPATGPSLFANQAGRWGRWRDGVLVEGKASTAAKLPVSAYIWTPWSKNFPHVQGLVLPDYQGGDGQLETGPACGDWLTLASGSPSHVAMLRLGGECAARADALVRFGCRVVDRSGYSPQGKPSPAKFHTQQGAQWADTNVAKFTIALADLRRAA